MTPADLVAVATIGSTLDVLTDFTADATKVAAALGHARLQRRHRDAAADRRAPPRPTKRPPPTTDDAASDTADMDMFNNDVRLRALKALAETLAPIEQKKAILYFSAGMQRSGEDNQVELRAAINAAVRAPRRRSIRSTPAGCRRSSPAATRRQASGRGTRCSPAAACRSSSRSSPRRRTRWPRSPPTPAAARSSTPTTSARRSRACSATCRRTTCSATAATNPAKDGRFRRIQVRVEDATACKVEARARLLRRPRLRAHRRGDRETQLQEQLFSAVSATDLPVLVTAGYFRCRADATTCRSRSPSPDRRCRSAETDKDKVALDVLGVVQRRAGPAASAASARRCSCRRDRQARSPASRCSISPA